jgi:hypothetical protein
VGVAFLQRLYARVASAFARVHIRRVVLEVTALVRSSRAVPDPKI